MLVHSMLIDKVSMLIDRYGIGIVLVPLLMMSLDGELKWLSILCSLMTIDRIVGTFAVLVWSRKEESFYEYVRQVFGLGLYFGVKCSLDKNDSFSDGEGMVVAQGIALFSVHFRDYGEMEVECVLMGCLMLAVACWPFFTERKEAFYGYGVLMGVGSFTYGVGCLKLKEPVKYIEKRYGGKENVGMVVYWMVVLGCGLPVLWILGKKKRMRLIVLRKMFHFLATLLFLPAVYETVWLFFSRFCG